MTLQINNIYGLLLIFVRTETMFMSVPVLGGATIPVQVRVMLGMIVSVIMLPVLPITALPVYTHASAIFVAMLYEFLIGLTMGIAMYAVVSCINFGADVISNEVGLMRTESIDPTSGEASGGGIGSLLFYFSLVVMLTLGVHRQIIAAVAESLHALPVGSLNTKGLTIDAMLDVTRQIFVIGVLMAAPFIAVNFLTNVTFSLLGKVAPKMNVFIVSFSFKILAGISVLATTGTLLAHYMEVEYSQIPSRMLDLVLGR